ncbi:MAG: DUF11 domain-containing protein, partial [Thermoanaerobaculia bacterium]|nr:DUF11 domain-containing protein [Thermoanaerobaculia bacterium]
MYFRNASAWALTALVACPLAALSSDPAARDYRPEAPGKGVDSPILPGSPEQAGGPDGFGYVYQDSNEPGGPAYSFQDISATGTPLGLGDDDEGNVTLPFSFPFYGVGYTTVRVGNNGGLLMASTGDVFAGNTCPMPDSGTAPLISVFFDDIDSETGNVYHQSFGSCPATAGGSGACWIVQWHQRPHYSNTGQGTFQAVLYQTGEILFQYQDTDFGNASYNFGAGASVGIEDEAQNASYVLSYSCNQANAIPNGLAILWGIPPTGDLALTKSGDVALGGPFAYTLEVTNNGPENQTGVTVTDVLPAELVYVSDSCGGDLADGSWSVGALANGASASCDLVVQLADPSVCVEVVNSASATGALFDPPAGSTAVNANGGYNLVQDPGFEDGTPNGFWAEASTNYGTPLCNTIDCNDTVGSSMHSGEWWVWFGGVTAFEQGSVSQSLTIPVGTTTLSFWLEVPTCGSNGASDFMRLTIDGNQLFSVDATAAVCNVVGYVQQSVDVSAYADGAAHTLAFESTTIGGTISNFFVDDVELVAPTTCPGEPIQPEVILQEIPTLRSAGLVALGLALRSV